MRILVWVATQKHCNKPLSKHFTPVCIQVLVLNIPSFNKNSKKLQDLGLWRLNIYIAIISYVKLTYREVISIDFSFELCLLNKINGQ